MKAQCFTLAVFIYSTRTKAQTGGDGTSQQRLVDFSKTHCTQKEQMKSCLYEDNQFTIFKNPVLSDI